jgi:hypothetical protein
VVGEVPEGLSQHPGEGMDIDHSAFQGGICPEFTLRSLEDLTSGRSMATFVFVPGAGLAAILDAAVS